MTLLDELTAAKKKSGRPALEYDNVTPHPLKKFFADLGITQTVLANRLGIGPAMLSLYLSGKIVIPSKYSRALQELANELQAEMDQKK